MDLKTFTSLFDTEDKCMDYLYRLRWKQGYHCPRCNHNEMWVVGEYKYKCKKCGYQTTVTSRTIFHDTRIPIQQWFRAIWYVSSKGNKATAAGLQKEVGLSSNRTALSMYKKIAFAKLRKVNPKLQGIVEVDKCFIRYNNKPYYIAVAVEICDKKIGKIQIGVIDTRHSEDMNVFIKNNIMNKSELICRNVWQNSNELFSKDYIKLNRSAEHNYPYSEKVSRHFQGWLNKRKKSADKQLEKWCQIYCSLENSFMGDIPFEDLLYLTIHKKLKSHEKLNSLADKIFKELKIR